MRAVSITNRHKETDENLRRKYMRAQPYCELYTMIVGILRDTPKLWGHFGGSLPSFVPQSDDPHHVMVSTPRWDDRRNLLALCRPVHDIVESKPIESFVWCLWRLHKVDRLDFTWMQERMRKSLPSWLDTDQFCKPDWHPLSVVWCRRLISLYTLP